MSFRITPVGVPFNADCLTDPDVFMGYMEDLLEALDWCHKNPWVVHRDVRVRNLIISYSYSSENLSPQDNRERLVLIDFDLAAKIGDETHYEGGYICCPLELLQKIKQQHTEQQFRRMQLQQDGEFDTDERCGLSSCKYIPQAFHDYQGFLILLVTLMYPRCFFVISISAG